MTETIKYGNILKKGYCSKSFRLFWCKNGFVIFTSGAEKGSGIWVSKVLFSSTSCMRKSKESLECAFL